MYYEEFSVGSLKTTVGRTVTETDIVLFAGLTGASNPLFLDEEFSRKTQFGHRIAPGLLTLSILTGLTYQLPGEPFGVGFIALLGMTFHALRPVYAGDTITGSVKVREKHAPKDGRGRVVLESIATNQRGEEVMRVENQILVKLKAGDSVASSPR